MGWKRASVLVWIIGWWTLLSWGAVSEPSRPVAQEERPLVADSVWSGAGAVAPDSVSVAAGDSVAALGQDSGPLVITDSLGALMPGDSIATRTETR